MNPTDRLPPNSIRETKRPEKKQRRPSPQSEIAPAPPPAAKKSTVKLLAAAASKDTRRAIPDDVKARFKQIGNKYHFDDGTLAFTDRGSRITSHSENTEVIRNIISIAQARGWSDITLTGTDRFKQEAWFAAKVAGLEVRGYAPSEYEEGRVVRALTRTPNKEERPRHPPANPTSRESISRPEGLRTGTLAGHGPAPYKHDPKNPMSYFVRLETSAGDREIWGVDLERAFRESLTKPTLGDAVGVIATRRDAVQVKIDGKKADVHRNRWTVEKSAFFKERAEAASVIRNPEIDPKAAAKKHPQLAGTLLKLHASTLAAKAIRDPQDRQRFLATVRHALADDIARGEPLTPVRLKESALVKAPAPREREQSPVR